MDKILGNIALATLNHMKQSDLFPYYSGQLKQLSKATVVGDDILISFVSPYSRALSQSKRHHHFGSKLADEQKVMVGKSLIDGVMGLLESQLVLLEGDFK